MKTSKNLTLQGTLEINELVEFVFNRQQYQKVSVTDELLGRIEKTWKAMAELIDKGVPIYGVTTGFGDSCGRYVSAEEGMRLQENLIRYLSCGLGEPIPVEAARAMCVIRLNSLSQGISGVSPELVQRMALLLEHDVVPVVPCEGSLGASGDLVPLAYLAQIVQGWGQAFYQGHIRSAEEVLKEIGVAPYKLKPKEGLAIVNGTSTMAGMVLLNLKLAQYLVEVVEISTSWLCMALDGRREAFGAFINAVAKKNPGQKKSAEFISTYLDQENYFPKRGQEVSVSGHQTEEFVQDRYSLRCVPQILGPIHENIEISWKNLEREVNSVTDNPVVDEEGRLEMGGNFYGGYLCQSMDFLKINLAHIADLVDRQVMMLMDERCNRGLPRNLINTDHMPEAERNIHHGLKGVHQVMSALTSEVIQKSIPSGIFSRSSESHNQDKVSLGMSAAMTCHSMLQGVYKLVAMQLVCFSQALDLKKVNLKGDRSRELYEIVRSKVAFVDRDASLGPALQALAEELKKQALGAH